MTIYQSSVKNIVQSSVTYKAYSETTGIKARYRDADGGAIGAKSITSGNLKFDLTYGFSEQILPSSIRFILGGETYIDRTGTLYRNIDQNNGSGTLSGEVKYGTGEISVSSWAPNTDNILTLESLATTTDLPPLSHISFRTPVIPLRPSSLTVVVGTLEHGQLTLTADENGVIETSRAHGLVNWDNGFVQIYFYTKTEVTAANRAELEAEDWYDPLLEYEEASKTYINVPVWVDASSVRYNAIAYTYLPIDSELLGLSATRLPIDGRVPIFRVGGIGIVSSTKSQELPSAIAGTTYDLNDQRIAWCELEDANGVKVGYDLYTVDYDYGRVTLGGDFVLASLVEPLVAKYRYQDMGQIRDVQINGQVTFTKPLTHNYDADNTIVGSALVINDMQARYTKKFVQQTWSNQWLDEPTGTLISANYNDALYPIQVTNKGAIQERWYIQFTDSTNYKCVGEYTGQIGTGTTNADYAPINPVTGVPYFVIKKEGWGSGWANGNVLRFNTIACNFPVWVIRTVKQSEPAVISDAFQIMLRGDIDRVI
ncbi:hypothetical protein [Acinetobacter sp. SH20PTE14]|uniref:hypothetical protein n=1 Tax=Acinetobacter sp. SH20PTE14 TaxID=2905879 RepID=UPI001F480E2E|nr:hypothetical protein [Acinetobacter sp. SH20PTE14]UIJ76963.1 hypothetical protein LXF01_06870 [Acinetobacter sp. SH20PTE14]UIJ77026.1 hypothetical protein LXF01_07200 [Acinetobacter sp. SH20PTE14]